MLRIGTSRGGSRAAGLKAVALALLLSASPLSIDAALAQQGQAAANRSFSIPAGPLSSALVAFGQQAGIQVSYVPSVAAGLTSPGIAGTMPPNAALARLLSGTGLSFQRSGANTVVISNAAGNNATATVDGAIALDTIDVSGGGGEGGTVYTPYETAAPTSHISGETIERFRGSSPADIFRGTPGVMSGEARNGGGSIDVNIRGMQGMGRVAVKIDGAENGLVVYQGYQGLSNRSFVDPDLLAGVDITKGSDVASRGIAGTVKMRTLSADDVVKPGEKWGGWVKSGFGTNTATPRPGDLGGYTWPRPYVSDPQPYPVPTASASGLNRPSLLDPTSGSFSAVTAFKEEKFDLLWGYAFRKQGNYFAGKNGPGAQVIDTGPQPLCYPSGFCYYPPHPISYAHVYKNGGLSSYRAGEQVLNTQLTTESWIGKATIRPDDDQTLQLGYTGYRSTAGDVVASLFSSSQSQAMQQVLEDSTELDTGTLRYRWNPEDSDLVDLKANLWLTKLTLRTPPRVSLSSVRPEDFGLPFHYLPGNNSKMWGGDVSNKSSFSFNQFGSLQFTYGMSYINESTEPLPFSNELNLNIPSRDGSREEVGVFGKAAYKPVDWLTLNGGLRYSHYRSEDRSNISSATQANPDPSRQDGGYSPSAGVVLEPVKGAQLYANYSSALRMPTLFEAVAAYTLIPNPDLGPERSNNWEVGVNLIKDGLFAPNDKAMLKFGYFNWNVKNYV
ncbi:MAG: TonB-dependent receptor, partial [Hyphomicrobiaceae bacterium]